MVSFRKLGLEHFFITCLLTRSGRYLYQQCVSPIYSHPWWIAGKLKFSAIIEPPRISRTHASWLQELSVSGWTEFLVAVEPLSPFIGITGDGSYVLPITITNGSTGERLSPYQAKAFVSEPPIVCWFRWGF